MTLTLLIISALFVYEKISVNNMVSKNMTMIDKVLAYVGLGFIAIGTFTYELEILGTVLTIGILSFGAVAIGIGTTIKADRKMDIVMALLGLTLFIPFANLLGSFLLALYLFIVKGKEKGASPLILGGALFLSMVAMIVKSVELASFVMILFLIALKIIHLDVLISMLRHVGTNVVTDALTGLFNRRWMFKQLEKLIEKNGEAGVIFIDIDNFKKLNDTKGHDYGDLVLKKIGDIMRQEVGASAWGVRYGGEELIVLVSKEIRSDALAKKILERVRKEVQVTLSIGVSVLDGKEQTPDQLIKIADERMYYSKNNGKNRITMGDIIINDNTISGEVSNA